MSLREPLGARPSILMDQRPPAAASLIQLPLPPPPRSVIRMDLLPAGSLLYGCPGIARSDHQAIGEKPDGSPNSAMFRPDSSLSLPIPSSLATMPPTPVSDINDQRADVVHDMMVPIPQCRAQSGGDSSGTTLSLTDSCGRQQSHLQSDCTSRQLSAERHCSRGLFADKLCANSISFGFASGEASSVFHWFAGQISTRR